MEVGVLELDKTNNCKKDGVMIKDQFSRTAFLIGKAAVEKLHHSTVAVFGIGGVGSFAVEGLARAGVGTLVLIDDDNITLTNLNRQLHATQKTLGRSKVEIMKRRILDINPKAEVIIYQKFYLPENADELIKNDYDYIVDAVDTVTAKIDLVINAKKRNIPMISCMGAGNKLDPTRFEVADIFETSVCPLAKVMRKELRKRGIDSLKVVYSKEEPIKPLESENSSCNEDDLCLDSRKEQGSIKRQIPGSISFVPSVAGLIMAGEVIKDLILLRAED